MRITPIPGCTINNNLMKRLKRHKRKWLFNKKDTLMDLALARANFWAYTLKNRQKKEAPRCLFFTELRAYFFLGAGFLAGALAGALAAVVLQADLLDEHEFFISISMYIG